jgi:hypothetical protein
MANIGEQPRCQTGARWIAEIARERPISVMRSVRARRRTSRHGDPDTAWPSAAVVVGKCVNLIWPQRGGPIWRHRFG